MLMPQQVLRARYTPGSVRPHLRLRALHLEPTVFALRAPPLGRRPATAGISVRKAHHSTSKPVDNASSFIDADTRSGCRTPSLTSVSAAGYMYGIRPPRRDADRLHPLRLGAPARHAARRAER